MCFPKCNKITLFSIMNKTYLGVVVVTYSTFKNNRLCVDTQTVIHTKLLLYKSISHYIKTEF